MLRSQYLAIERLDLPGVHATLEAHLGNRVPDVMPRLRLSCGQADE